MGSGFACWNVQLEKPAFSSSTTVWSLTCYAVEFHSVVWLSAFSSGFVDVITIFSTDLVPLVRKSAFYGIFLRHVGFFDLLIQTVYITLFLSWISFHKLAQITACQLNPSQNFHSIPFSVESWSAYWISSAIPESSVTRKCLTISPAKPTLPPRWSVFVDFPAIRCVVCAWVH